MKASELVLLLENLIHVHGDLDVITDISDELSIEFSDDPKPDVFVID